jgi:Spy/CpxP family protein refolding chaperone
MKRYIAMAALVLAALATQPAFADQSNAGGADRHHGWSQRFQQELGLTDAQMQAMRDIRARQRDQSRQIFKSLIQANKDLRHLSLSGAEQPAIQAKMAEIAQLQQQALALRVAALQEIAPQLTDEQKQKLADWSPWRGHHRAPKTQPNG